MRNHLMSLTVLLALLGLASAAHGQQYPGYSPYYGQPYYGPAQPAAYLQGPGYAPPMDYGPAGCATGSCTDGACGDCNCDACWQSCRQPRGWFASFEYNMWWSKTRDLPPLVTTSPPGTPQLQTGVLPDATILFGGGRFGDDIGNGGRLTLGKWLDPQETAAIGVRFLAWRADDGAFSAASDGTTNLAIPFFDTFNDAENALLVAFTPDGTNPFAAGSVDVQDRIDLLSTDIFTRFLVYSEPGIRYDLLGGYHTLRLDNSLRIASFSESFNPAIVAPIGTTIATEDIFEGRNEFHGGTLGVNVTAYCDCWTFSALGKFSVGNMRETILIDGTTVISVPGDPVDVREEGFFALGTNQGVREQDRVAYIPEVELKMAYAIRQNLSVSLGYSFLYINNVILAGSQVDRNLNLTQTNNGPLIGPATPQFLGFRETDFWAQGLNFGLDWRF